MRRQVMLEMHVSQMPTKLGAGIFGVCAWRRALHRQYAHGHGFGCAQDSADGDVASLGHRPRRQILWGSLGTAVLVLFSGQYLSGEGAVASAALNLAKTKVSLSFDRMLFLGILCNVLVCLAVWLSIGARSTGDKILAVLFPASAFVVAGFEHSVANMYFVPLGLLIKGWAPDSLWSQIAISPEGMSALTRAGFLWHLVPVTLGNLIGGAVLVGGVYWFIYLRPRK